MDVRQSPPIHYVWVGPPPDNSKTGVAGHDTACVKLMAEQNKSNPIIFWCLKKDRKHYKETFEDTSVQVKSIESCLNEFSKDASPIHVNEFPHLPEDYDNEQAAQTLKNLKSFFNIDDEGGSKSSIRDKVTFKVLFNLFLLMTKGGYTLDTNIRPSEDKAVDLPKKDAFTIARVVFQNQSEENECFLMYAPPQDQNSISKIKDVFTRHYSNIEMVDDLRKENKVLYAHSLGESIIFFLTKSQPKFFLGNKAGMGKVVFEGLNLSKFYFNTHKPQAIQTSLKNEDFIEALKNNKLETIDKQKKIDNPFIAPPAVHPIYVAIQDKNEDLVRLLIQNGEDVNRRSLFSDELGATPLHYAIRANDTDAVILLINLGADPNLTARDQQGKEQSAFDLAKELYGEEAVSLLVQIAEEVKRKKAGKEKEAIKRTASFSLSFLSPKGNKASQSGDSDETVRKRSKTLS